VLAGAAIALALDQRQAELEQMVNDGLADSRQQLQRLFYDVRLSANDTVLGCLHELVSEQWVLLGTDSWRPC
jgi:hypothetical protein